MLYIENLKTLHQKIIRKIDISNEIVGYRVNTEKSVVFLYTNNELSEREINKTNRDASKIFYACGLEERILLSVHTTQRKSQVQFNLQ